MGDVGPAGMFTRSKSAGAKALRSYRERLGSSGAKGKNTEVKDEKPKSNTSSVASGLSSQQLPRASSVVALRGTSGKPQEGDCVEVTRVLGYDREGLVGQRGEVVGTVALPMFGGKVSASVRFSEAASSSCAPET